MDNVNYYVGVTTPKGMIYVTDYDKEFRTATWNPDKKPLKMNKSDAWGVSAGITKTGTVAVMIKSVKPITKHCCMATT